MFLLPLFLFFIKNRVKSRRGVSWCFLQRALISKKAQKSLLKEVKMLLLGAGECGKSTIVKQMKIIHDKGYSMEEREMFRDLVFSNVVHSLYTIVINMEGLGIQFGEKENLIVAESFCQNAEGTFSFCVTTVTYVVRQCVACVVMS